MARTKTVARRGPGKAWALIGQVGVDSGQVLLCDPCYIDGEWKRDTESPGHAAIALSAKGKAEYPQHAGKTWKFPFPWGTYADPSPEFGGKSMNDLGVGGMLLYVDTDPTGEFSYKGCCEAATSKLGAGQLNYNLGHVGAGVAVSTHHGDGIYPVFAKMDKEGRVVQVMIDFDWTE